MISRSGIVDRVEGCTVLRIKMLIQTDAGWCASSSRPGRELQVDPSSAEAVPAAGTDDWTVLHSDRGRGNQLEKLRSVRIGKVRKLVTAYITDRGTMIVGLPDRRPASGIATGQFSNCHGLTFANAEAAIVGWYGGRYWHTKAEAYDQATAVQIILDENGYRKVHAKDKAGVDHF